MNEMDRLAVIQSGVVPPGLCPRLPGAHISQRKQAGDAPFPRVSPGSSQMEPEPGLNRRGGLPG